MCSLTVSNWNPLTILLQEAKKLADKIYENIAESKSNQSDDDDEGPDDPPAIPQKAVKNEALGSTHTTGLKFIW